MLPVPADEWCELVGHVCYRWMQAVLRHAISVNVLGLCRQGMLAASVKLDVDLLPAVRRGQEGLLGKRDFFARQSQTARSVVLVDHVIYGRHRFSKLAFLVRWHRRITCPS